MVNTQNGKGCQVLIGELSERSQCSKDTLRFYEKLGLIQGKVTNGTGNNYKHYDQETLDRLRLIKHAKAFGFTLKEISKLIDDWESDKFTHAQKRAIINEKLQQVEQKLQDLLEVKAFLVEKMSCYQG